MVTAGEISSVLFVAVPKFLWSIQIAAIITNRIFSPDGVSSVGSDI